MRRFTRLTNAFSKKVENLAHAVSLHYMHYNFARVHQSLTITGEDEHRGGESDDTPGHDESRYSPDQMIDASPSAIRSMRCR